MKTKNLLKKPHWNYRNVMEYCEVKTTKAYEIMKIVRKEYGGTIKHLPDCVRRNSVLTFLGTTLEEELKIVGDD